MPSYLISLPALRNNAEILRDVADRAGCRIVLALKGFSCWHTFNLLSEYLDGCCASGIWEAKLADKYFNKNILSYSPAYSDDEFDALLEISHHIDFNSITQWLHFKEKGTQHPKYKSKKIHFGLRINPEYSTGYTPLYDPCIPGSRLGIPVDQLEGVDLSGISGLHFHTLCEQNSDDLLLTWNAIEEKFGHILSRPEITWLNMGGGHWITKPFYDREKLVSLIQDIRRKYNVDVWLEPGEAAAIHTGVLRAKVLDVFESMGYSHAILDVSASAHMPDTLEMPYRPDVFLIDRSDSTAATSGNHPLPSITLPGESYTFAGPADSLPYTYRLGASTCLAGDIHGDYSFPRPLVPGDELIFDDMAHYTMVKTTFFNGVRHPDIALLHEDGRIETVRRFSYMDFESRLG